MKKLIYLFFALLPLSVLASGNSIAQADSLPDAEPKIWVYSPEGKLLCKGILHEITEDVLMIDLNQRWKKRFGQTGETFSIKIDQVGYVKILDNPHRHKLLARNIFTNYFTGSTAGFGAGAVYWNLIGQPLGGISLIFAIGPAFSVGVGVAAIIVGGIYIHHKIR